MSHAEYRHRRELLAAGYDDHSIAAAVANQSMTRIWAGAYYRGEPLRPWQELALAVRAASARTTRGLAVSGSAAAVLHGMQIFNSDWRTVEFTADGRSGGSNRGRRRVRRLDGDDVVELDGMMVTTVARTAVDLALDGTFDQAVCALDAVLRLGVTRNELAAAVERLGRRRGASTLRAALPHATALSDSVGESLSRALMIQWPEIPAPVLQFEVFGPAGNLVARTDFMWSGRVVGEFDGTVKLRERDAEDQLIRDNLLTERGWVPTHWRWRECMEPDRLRARLHSALGPAGLLLTSRGQRQADSRSRSSVTLPVHR